MTRTPALWKQFDTMKAELVGCTCIPGYSIDDERDYIIIERRGKGTVEGKCFDWAKLIRSFYHNREWREARKAFLAEHPQCTYCPDRAISAHHAGGNNLQSLVVKHDFHYVLEHMELCDPICRDCHAKLHGIITDAQWLEAKARSEGESKDDDNTRTRVSLPVR